MNRNEVLAAIHAGYRPRSYLEIGINTGRSLRLSRTRTVAVDPAFRINCEIRCDIQVVKAASDDFFARPNPLEHLPDGRADLAFVDGLHLFEFVLRDFMNVERHVAWTSVIVVDDALPRSVAEASRDRDTIGAWAGDVFKLGAVLKQYRPDLLVLALDTDPTGVFLVLGADASSTTLRDRYDEIVAEQVYADPQRVPESVLNRRSAIDPASIDAAVWTRLREAREAGAEREAGWRELRLAVEAAARPAAPRELTPARLRARSRPKRSPPPPVGRVAVLRSRLRPLRRAARSVRRRLAP